MIDFIEKIDNTISVLGDDLREYPACTSGNYLENRDQALPLSSISNWTQSFFTGQALLAYAYTGNQKYTDWCDRFYKDYYDKVFKTPDQTMHDLGFLFTPYAVGLYRLLKDDKMRELGLRAAQVLAMRFDPKSRHIRAWGNMQNQLPDDLPPGDDGFFYFDDANITIAQGQTWGQITGIVDYSYDAFGLNPRTPADLSLTPIAPRTSWGKVKSMYK